MTLYTEKVKPPKPGAFTFRNFVRGKPGGPGAAGPRE